MKVIELDILNNSDTSAELIDTIRKGGVFIYPTDTLYGIGGLFSSIEVIKKIDKIKGRGDKPYSIAVSDFGMLKRFVNFVPKVFTDKFLKLLPGKYTFLFEAKEDIDKSFIKGSKKIGIRIPAQGAILSLINLLGEPIITTSVNESGEKPLNSVDLILDFIHGTGYENTVDFVLDGGTLPASQGSIIVDLTTEKPEYIRI